MASCPPKPGQTHFFRRYSLDHLRDQLQASLGAAYTLERELGGGGMSRVFVAEDLQLHRKVVIKVLPEDLAADVSTKRFKREIQIFAQLQHPNIVPVLSVGDVGGVPYYTMPFVQGASLRQLLKESVAVPLERSLEILRDVAKALSYAHKHGIVHRDIKPENVLLTDDTAVVTDFGIAKALAASKTEGRMDTLTTMGRSLGTPAYMAPEQVAADPEIDQRADVYSWGVVAYELLSGRHPFADVVSPQQMLAAQLTVRPPPLEKKAPGVPPGIAAVIMQCLEKNPRDRPQTAANLLATFADSSSNSSGQEIRRVLSRTSTVALIVIAALGVAAFFSRHQLFHSPNPSGSPTLAVLPFENIGAPSQEYFVDGLTDAVTGKLSALREVRVIDRRSAMQYRHTSKSVRQIGNELGAGLVLEGVVRWSNNTAGDMRAQVTPTLVDAAQGTTMWTGVPIVLTPRDPFQAQTEIATRVAAALQLALDPTERNRLEKKPTDNAEAYDAYLRGMAIQDALPKTAMSSRDLDRGIANFERALKLDPKFVDAWHWLAVESYYRIVTGSGDPQSLARIKQAVAQLKQLAPGAAHTLEIEGVYEAVLGNDRRAAELTRLAAQASDADAEALRNYAFFLANDFLTDSAIGIGRRALGLDPRSGWGLHDLSRWSMAKAHWGDARKYADLIIALDSSDERGWEDRVDVAMHLGDTTQMQREIARAQRIIPSPTNRLLGFMAYAGEPMASRYIAMSAGQLRVETLGDSVSNYYDNKADVFLGRGDSARAVIYEDSIRLKLENRSLGKSTGLYVLLAHAQAVSGHIPEARVSLGRAFQLAKPQVPAGMPPDFAYVYLSETAVPAILGRIGEVPEAVRILRLNTEHGLLTRTEAAMTPKFRFLHGNPLFETYLRGG